LLFLLLGRRRNRGNLAKMTLYIHLPPLLSPRLSAGRRGSVHHCCARLIKWLHNTQLPPGAIAARNRCAVDRDSLRNDEQIMPQNRKITDFDVQPYTTKE
jgi:hypothetical protein